MRKEHSVLMVAFASLATLLLVLGEGRPTENTQAQPAQPAVQPKEKLTRVFKRHDLLQLLKEEIVINDPFQVWKLGDAVEFLYDRMIDEKKIALPILLDAEAFRAEDPDEWTPPKTPYEVMVKFPSISRKWTYDTALEHLLSQVPTRNAVYLVRKGRVEITTRDAASPEFLLAERVSAIFNKTPLDEAIEELADQSGMAIVIDPRLGEKSKTPVTATFANNSSLEAAVILLANLVDAEPVVMRDTVLITTSENAQKLRPLQQQMQQMQPVPRKRPSHIGGPVIPGLG